MRSKLSDTPLHEACTCPSVAGAELLLRWGADEKNTNEGGFSPADRLRD
ncbi:unnamed protein product [Pylaiella littoralis]